MVLPKFSLGIISNSSSDQGVLFSELLLALSVIVNWRVNWYLIKSYSGFPRLLIFLFLVFFIYVVFSSTISGILIGEVPFNSYLYFLRIFLYVQLFVVIRSNNVFKLTDNFSWYILLRNSYLVHALISIGLFIFYYLKLRPDFNDMIWRFDVGHRLIPMIGLSFNPLEESWFAPIGGGSSNLLGTWTSFVLILTLIFERSFLKRALVYSLTVIMLFLSQTRGGLLTALLIIIYSVIYKGTRRSFPFIFVLSLALIVFGLYYLSDYLQTSIPMMSRIVGTLDGNELDGSSAARIVNYLDTFRAWSSSIFYVVFGIGFDERQIFFHTGWTLVESFYLSLLFSSGLIGFLGFVFFVIMIYLYRNKSIWLKVLFLFIIFNSIFNWSITGSDILSASGLFPLILCLTLSMKNSNETVLVK